MRSMLLISDSESCALLLEAALNKRSGNVRVVHASGIEAAIRTSSSELWDAVIAFYERDVESTDIEALAGDILRILDEQKPVIEIVERATHKINNRLGTIEASLEWLQKALQRKVDVIGTDLVSSIDEMRAALRETFDHATALRKILGDVSRRGRNKPIDPAVAADTDGSSRTEKRPAILVIDDDETVGYALRRALKPEFEVTAVTDGREALARLDAGEEFDVILCDLLMPDLTGMEIHEALAQRAQKLADRMIFLTGGTFSPRARQFIKRVPNERLDKPFRIEQLKSLLLEVIGRAR